MPIQQTFVCDKCENIIHPSKTMINITLREVILADGRSSRPIELFFDSKECLAKYFEVSNIIIPN